MLSDDSELIRQMLAGEESAFNAFFDSYFPRVYRFALARLGRDPEAARDVVQATLTKAVGRLTQYRGDASLFTWLCQICRHQIVDYLRANRRHRNVVSIDSDPDARTMLDSIAAPEDQEPARQRGNEETRQLIRSVLDRLPGRYGDVLEWKYVEDRSVEEIGEMLGIGHTAAQSLLARARSSFREALTATLGASAPDLLAQLGA